MYSTQNFKRDQTFLPGSSGVCFEFKLVVAEFIDIAAAAKVPLRDPRGGTGCEGILMAPFRAFVVGGLPFRGFFGRSLLLLLWWVILIEAGEGVGELLVLVELKGGSLGLTRSSSFPT